MATKENQPIGIKKSVFAQFQAEREDSFRFILVARVIFQLFFFRIMEIERDRYRIMKIILETSLRRGL